MVIQFGVKEHIKMAETYQWAEEELAKQRKWELELLEDSRRYWQGETADAFRQEHEFMLMEGEYAAYMKHVRGMKEVMEDSIPRFRQLQQMVVELPTAYGLPCDDEAPETLRLDEEAVAQYHELSDEIIAKNRHFCEEMTRIMDGCEGLVDFSEEKRELEELREEMQQMEVFKSKLDEYADEMRRMDNWMVERLSEYTKIGDGTVQKSCQHVSKDLTTQVDTLQQVEEYDCYLIRDGLSLSTNTITECMMIIENLYQAGFISMEDYENIGYWTMVAEQSPTYVANMARSKLQGYFDHVVTTVYIYNCLLVLAYRDISPQECRKINGILQDFGIIDCNSIACFLICCAGESTGFTEPIEDYEINPNYTEAERGAGYIQVTYRETQRECLNYICELFGYQEFIDPSMDGYAELIANKYPWEASAWYWAVLNKVRREGEEQLNRYVVGRINESGEDLSLGLVLSAECFVHGNVKNGISPILGQIVLDENLRSKNDGEDGGWYIEGRGKNYILHIPAITLETIRSRIDSSQIPSEWGNADELSFSAPSNWEVFENAYIELKEVGLIEFDLKLTD